MISSVQADAFVESTAGARLTVRKALMRDIPPILQLINGYAAKGIMLPRTEFEPVSYTHLTLPTICSV